MQDASSIDNTELCRTLSLLNAHHRDANISFQEKDTFMMLMETRHSLLYKVCTWIRKTIQSCRSNCWYAQTRTFCRI